MGRGPITRGVVKALLAYLETSTPEDAPPVDFIDLGRETESKATPKDGGCIA